MRNRRWVLLAVVLGLAAWWWSSRPSSPTADAVHAGVELEHVGASSPVDLATKSLDARVEVAPVVSPDASAGVERIETVDEHEVAVADVELFDASAGEPIRLGATDASGVLALANPLHGLTRVRTRVSSELEQDHEVPADSAGTLVLHVDAGDSIRGIVTLLDGSQPPVQVDVIAWSDDAAIDVRNLAQRAMHGDPGVPHARTNPDGSFAIPRMMRNKKYLVTAGALGWMTKTYPNRATAGGSDVTIAVQPLYAAVVRFVDARTRGPVRMSPRLSPVGHARSGMQVPDAHASWFAAGGANSVLAGLPSELFADELSLQRFVEACTHADSPSHVGPFELAVDLPGYRAATLEYFAEPLSKGLHELELALEPIDAGRGELAIRWIGVADSLRLDARTALPSITLMLTPESGPPLVYKLDGFSKEEEVIDQIPFGNYDALVELQIARPNVRVAERKISITDGRAEIEVDVRSVGAVVIDVVNRDGSAYVGAAAFTLALEASGGFSTVPFRGPPYVLLGLPPQRWRVGLMKPLVRDADQLVEVAAGDLAHLRFVLP